MKQFESFRLDTCNQCLWRDGAQISIPPKPFAVLRYLVENPDRLVSHDELLDALWPETYVQPQVLRTYVLDLRKMLGDDAGQPRFIQTLPKRGYRFMALVTECGDLERGAEAPRKTAIAKAAGLVGRVEEFDRLRAAMQQVATRQRRVVFVCGEAGIGKTALVDAFYREVESSHAATVARGQCVQGIGSNEEYYPVMEALSQLCASAEGETAYRTLAKLAPAWLTPTWRTDRETLEAESAGEYGRNRERMLGDLCGALEELAAEKPHILIFEDLEWADECTLRLISALARRRAAAKLMVLATYRPTKGLTEHPLKGLRQDLLVRRLCVEISLGPLAKAEVRALASRELGQEELPRGLDRFVYQRAEGNPLFVIAILEHMIAERMLVRQSVEGMSAWEQAQPFADFDGGVPSELAKMIELEVERLSPGEQSMLEAGSLMSVAFPSWAVAAALGRELPETEEACDAMARRVHFVERVGQDELPDGTTSAFYVFVHGLYREVIYRRQTTTRRAKRHICIAERLQAMFAGREADVAREVAMHYEAGGDWVRSAHALRAAAQRAQKRRAFAEAAELLEHALRILENRNVSDPCVEAEEIRFELQEARGSFCAQRSDESVIRKSLTIS